MRLPLLLSLFFAFSLISAQEKELEVEGGIKIGDVQSTPEPGTIRWTGEDFEGWNGTEWVSLTGGNTAAVTDAAGNTYKTVKIGDQIWMAENLRTTRYRNGELVTLTQSNGNWTNATFGAYCWYNNDNSYEVPYGKLYNWLAVNDSRGLCPVGWQVPSAADWQTLYDYLGGQSIAGGKMKQVAYWSEPNFGATNGSGFSAIGAGDRGPLGDFFSLGSSTTFWTRDMTPNFSIAYLLNTSNADVVGLELDRRRGLSVRCIKDASP